MAVRERVVLAFLSAAVVATFGLGGAVAYSFGHGVGTIPTTSFLTPSTGAAATGTDPAAGTTAPAPAPGAPPPGTAGHAAAAAPGAASPVVPRAAAAVAAAAPGGVAPGGTITVGGIYEESGPVDATPGRDAVRAYFNEVNAAGGVNGHTLRLVDCDSAFDPTRGHQCSERLANSGILAMVGWLSPSSEQAEAGYLTQRGIPTFGGLGVPAEFQSPLSYPVGVNLMHAVEGFSTHAAELGIRAPALVIINTPFTSPAGKAFTDSLHRHGIHEKSLDFVDATKPDYTDLAVKIRLEGADSIMAGLDPFSYARLFQALDRQNFHPPFMGVGLDKPSAERQYGTAVYGAESAAPFLEPDEHADVPAMREYHDAMQRYFPAEMHDLDTYSEGAWISAKVFVAALRRIGTAPVTPRALVEAANGLTNFETGLTTPLTFGPGAHDANHCLQWIRNQQGTWHTYSGWNCF
ncbi:MAG TPA: ABC transporter substrate-binding protein [Candidatus Dormibacteraeota bacterium]|nr:ABC transporter substrate-binding protein [Candidatus Dormibacteraeota bacterium]